MLMHCYLLQLSELEQRVIEAEERAEEAEDKVSNTAKNSKFCKNKISITSPTFFSILKQMLLISL